KPVGLDGTQPVRLEQIVLAQSFNLSVGVDLPRTRDAFEPAASVEHQVNNFRPQNIEVELSSAGAITCAEVGFAPPEREHAVGQKPGGGGLVVGWGDAVVGRRRV